MRVLLVAVGRLRPAFREICDDYLRRFGRFLAIDEHEVREAGRAANDAMRRAAEGKALLAAIPEQSRVVLLDGEGTPWSSPELAAQLDGWRRDARDCTFVVGGVAGVSPAVRHRADVAWSLGRLTLPHEFARVVVVEQLYRASTILRGEPYHRGAR